MLQTLPVSDLNLSQMSLTYKYEDKQVFIFVANLQDKIWKFREAVKMEACTYVRENNECPHNVKYELKYIPSSFQSYFQSIYTCIL